MKRRKILFRIVYAVAALAVLLSLAYVFLLPWLVGRQIAAALNDAGMGAVRFHISRLSPWRLELAGITTGGSAPDTIDRIAVSFSPSTLRHGRVTGVQLSGVDLALVVKDGRIEAGPFAGAHFAGSSGAAPPLRLPFDRIDLGLSTLTLKLPDQDVKLPATGSVVTRADGKISVGIQVMLDGKAINVDGLLGPASTDLDLSAHGEGLNAGAAAAIASAFSPSSRVSASGALSFNAWVQRNAGQANAAALIWPAGLSMSIAPRQGAGSPTSVSGIDGVFEADATAVPGVPTRGKMTIRSASFSETSTGIAAGDLSLFAEFDDLLKLSTTPDQWLSVGKLNAGKVELTNGTLLFRQEGLHLMSVRKTRWDCLGGTAWAENFNIDLSQRVISTIVQTADIDLQKLLALVAPDKASGEGRVSGGVPIVINWPDVRFGTGGLQAAPGGTLQVKDLQPLSSSLDQAAGGQAGVKQKILQALGDFRYDVMTAGLANGPEGLEAHVHLVGRARSGAKPPIDIELNFHGLSDLLKFYLGFQRQISG